MTGDALKHEITKRGYTIKSIAIAMKTSPQNLSGKLASDNVTTGLMEQVADLMGIDVVEFYGHIPDDSNSVAKIPSSLKDNPSCDVRLLDLIANRDKQIDKQYEQNILLLNEIRELRMENQQLLVENTSLKARLSILCPPPKDGENS